jgi:hypothetical protein
MKKIILLLLFVSSFANAQISIQKENNNLNKIEAVVDSTLSIKDYKNASQFLGLVGNKIYNLPPNNVYASKKELNFNFRYVAKEKIKTKDGRKYNVGELLPVYYGDFYKNNIAGKYFTVTKVEFYKGYKNELVTPEEWQK